MKHRDNCTFFPLPLQVTDWRLTMLYVGVYNLQTYIEEAPIRFESRSEEQYVPQW
jgi:hypothetical protein